MKGRIVELVDNSFGPFFLVESEDLSNVTGKRVKARMRTNFDALKQNSNWLTPTIYPKNLPGYELGIFAQ